MEPKKSELSNLENKRVLFFQIGFILVLAMMLFAFEYEQGGSRSMTSINRMIDATPVEEIPVTIQKTKLPPPVKPALRIIATKEDLPVDNNPIFDASISLKEELFPVPLPKLKQDETIPEPKFYTAPEQMPTFPGGMEALAKYLATNLHYPSAARNAQIQGRVFVNFIIENDGSVTSANILRGIGGGCDEEALRVVSQMPRWTPGRQNGIPVRVSFNLPVNFKLR